MKRLGPNFLNVIALVALLGPIVKCAGQTTVLRRNDGPEQAAASTEHHYTNRLAREKSPYLLQHAHNPVDWFPWAEAAFARARKEDKPILLSIGYSTCHWCHVMERESFENEQIARLINENFVAIKVDREERPDVDAVYMRFIQAATGGGGWPMTIFLTPELKPFFGGTYFAPDDFSNMLQQTAKAWKTQRPEVVAKAGEAIEFLQRQTAADRGSDKTVNQSLFTPGFEAAARQFDPKEGGFGGGPKFPRPVMLNFLFRIVAREGRASKNGKAALDMALLTLRKMAAGGIHDHLGGGFHRYSVDEFWQVPHFEKMLYDQAQLATAYLDAFQITREPLFEQVARDILAYVGRDLAAPEGAFYSAEDADSQLEPGKTDRGEGAFYVWNKDQIDQVLDQPAAGVFAFHYGVEAAGNVPGKRDPRRELAGKNVLIQRRTLAETSEKFKLKPDQVESLLAVSRQKLFQARERRPRPQRDDKIITAWNGLMISAFARADQVLGDAEYRQAAERAARFVREKLFRKQTGELIRSYRQSAGSVAGFVDDYAFFIQGLLDLYEAGFDVQWLKWAAQLQEKQDALFADTQHGGYYSVSGQDRNILLRMKDDYDGAEPSPNSVAALNLLRLAQMTGREEWTRAAERTFMLFGDTLRRSPTALPQLLVALDFHSRKPKQIVIAGKPEAADTLLMVREVHREFIPNKILLLADGANGQEFLAGNLEFIKSVKMLRARATAYVCENYVCKLPTDDLGKLRELLAVAPKP
jgi:uncharacterized protein YyaL (SSP411 family)